MAACVIVPAAASLLPQFPLAAWPGRHDHLWAMDWIGRSTPQTISAPSDSDSTVAVPVPGTVRPSESHPGRSAGQGAQATRQWVNTPQSALSGQVDMRQLFILCWLVGTALSSSVFLVSLALQHGKLRRARAVDDADWVDSVATAARALALPLQVPTLESDEVCVPAVVGVFRPRLVVPRGWRVWGRAQRHCILLHELAHIKRRDVAAQLLARLAFLTYWFHPLMWYAIRQLRIERELACDDCVLRTGQAASDYAEQLLCTLRWCRFPTLYVGVAMAHSARLDRRVRAILDPQRRRYPVGPRLAIILVGTVAAIGTVLSGVTLTAETPAANPPTASDSEAPAVKTQRMWKENYTIEYPGTVPVSVAFSIDGQILLTGDANGEVMALIFDGDDPKWRWKTQVGPAHAAVAFSADQKKVYATYRNGVRILDAEHGTEEDRIDAPESNPTALGVFPDQRLDDGVVRSQIVFGGAGGYFVKSWVPGRLPETLGTIETRTVAEGIRPTDAAAVPLAVDPKGRSAIMTGPIDATGEVTGSKGQYVLWAYVCGDYGPGSPGNRVMVGHSAPVVSAAWAADGNTAVTGDAAGRVIVWDAATMKESQRMEMGGRVLSLAISRDGARTAAWVVSGNGCDLYLWETANPSPRMQPIHRENGDFRGPAVYGSLDFAPDGRRLAGSAVNKVWLSRLGELVGKVHVWELENEPRAQLPPQPSYTKALPEGSSSEMVILNNHTLLMPVAGKGALDLRSVATGEIQARLVLGPFMIGRVKLSSDRNWLAIEQHPQYDPATTTRPEADLAIVVYRWPMQIRTTIPQCRQLLDVASGGKGVAVVRDGSIEVWDAQAVKVLKSAPFHFVRIDAAAFSPDGSLLAISDRNELVLWNWEAGQHERIDLGRTVGSLTFSPDGKYLAEGPSPRHEIQIREVATGRVVQSLDNGTRRSMNVPSMVYSQGGRVLIACDNITHVQEIAVSHRIYVWDTVTGAVAHRIALPGQLPSNLGVSPNGRHLVTVVDDGQSGKKLRAWRLDGRIPVVQPLHEAPASVRPE
jgi:beta-lactamase regulating signal transducer with metallopeptidase domain/WD40 repeat protein